MAFSVLMSVYKNENPIYLKACLKSIENQTLMPNEVLLMLDGPIPEPLKQVIEEAKWDMPYLKTHQIIENVQLGRALQQGVELCSYDLIARMDTDDVACLDRFQLQYDFMCAHPAIDVCGGWIKEFHDIGDKTKLKQMPTQMNAIIPYAKYRNPVNHMTVMMRKKSVLKAGNYKHFPFLEDYHLWIRMLSQGCEFYNLEQILVEVRANDCVYQRRGGVTYCKNHLSLRKLQHELKMTSRFEYVKGVCLSIAITMQPSVLRKVVYKTILRK